MRTLLHIWAVLTLIAFSAHAADPDSTRTADVIYGRTYGTTLTLDVFTPTHDANGFGVIVVVSGGWVSAHESLDSPFFAPYISVFTKRGYTVFAVVHGSQPKYTIPEILPQLSRAVRFVRYHAREYKIDPDHLGIVGGSAGGHLSLMQGCAPLAPSEKSPDPVDRVSAAVQAVGAFFPPTDFLNWGKKDHDALGRNEFSWIHAPFDFHNLDDKTHSFVPITDEARIHQIGHDISPIYHISPQTPPTLIIHGDKDPLVPLQQAQIMIDALQKAGIPNKLIVKPGAGHGWPKFEDDLQSVADWFDLYLRKQPAPTTKPAATAPSR